ncbi:hypothetical protein BPLS_P4081 [Bathymodiolus platifrons methanotrophic gill symbiont]|uniref:pentapeptide repeat-containing protein n=1 Tax=Bathymodiolus platifrons methanotrophic gill symbiont TaxID=113268 RepID=UPI001B4D2AA6|nr:pentapeptide repeat-containing protein [Bathymodiolus platifrons methanotrophic gill symbiont]GFO76354.1 hypothetical protein BPLS_P4081 [Bathymodiolus platifrons methanotrophic gill symbiont]
MEFNGAQFGDGHVEFSHAKFGNGDLEFKRAKFGNGTLNFEHCEFKGYVSFQSMTETKTLSKFSLRHSSFDKSLDISDNTFNCIPDLTNTKLTNQVSLGRMKIKKKYSNGGDHDVERLCRLKELAEANRSYQQALEFHLMEMRANRSLRNDKLVNILDIIFDLIAIYGQSIARPVILLFAITLIFGCYYEEHLNILIGCEDTYNGFLYSLSQVFTFVSFDLPSRSVTLKCETIPQVSYLLRLLQGLLSFIFLFLIGLGFRNRFRL